MHFDNNFCVKNKQENKSKDKELIMWTCISAVASLIIVFLLFVITTDLLSKITYEVKKATQDVNISPSLPFLPKRQTILLVGVDSQEENFRGARSDTLMLVNLDPTSSDINAISIPRDSKVYLGDNKNPDKINHAFAKGGAELSLQTIENTLGISIDHYIVVNYKALKEIVGAVGGVPVYVEKNMYYKDKTAHLYINLKKGEQVLDPDQAEQFVRFRHDSLADIGRIQRQQIFLRGLTKKFQSPSIIPKIPEIIRIANKHVLTDMNLYELSELAAYVRNIDFNKIQIASLPGNPSKKGQISYWILHPEEVQNIVDRLIYRIDEKPKTKDLSVGIGYEKRSVAKTIKIIRKLKAAGYQVKCAAKLKNPRMKIISHSDYVTLKTAEYLKKRLLPIKESQFVVAPSGYICGKTDLSIIVAGN